MAKTIQVEWQREAGGTEYYIESQYPHKRHSVEEVRNNSFLFTIKESVVGIQERERLNESAPLGPGWTKDPNWKPNTKMPADHHRIQRLGEPDRRKHRNLPEAAQETQEVIGIGACLTKRGFKAPNGGTVGVWTRGVNLSVTVKADGSWMLNGINGSWNGKDKANLDTALDSRYPIGESFRERRRKENAELEESNRFRDKLVTAYRELGMSEAEAQAFCVKEERVIHSAWIESVLRTRGNTH